MSNLRATWSTPNAVHWDWDLAGSADLQSFAIVVADSTADLTTCSGSARLFGPADNPELGYYSFPTVGSLVRKTITDGHVPDRDVVAQLVAIDTSGKRSVTNVAATRTLPAPGNEIVVFSEEATAGYSIPENVLLSTTAPYAGSYCYECVLACPGGSARCWEWMRRQGIDVDLSAIPADAYDGAFVEVAVSCDGTVHAFYAGLRLMFGTASSTTLYNYEPITLRCDGRYRLYQLPIRAFESSMGPVPHSDLSRGLREISVGSEWTTGTTIRFDEYRILW